MPAHTDHHGEEPVSPHETTARLRKVLRIVATIPFGELLDGTPINADFLERCERSERNVIALWAGCRPPSDTTWAMVVQFAREREAAQRDR